MSDPSTFTILTAASESFGPSLLAMLGSLDRNWPGHPPVHVFDIGLECTTLDVIKSHGIPVTRVPEFCPHWRRHWTWKLWCWQNSPSQGFIWFDAGLVVLRPLDEMVSSASKLGYFLVSTERALDEAASDGALRATRVERAELAAKVCLAGTHLAFDRHHEAISEIVTECFTASFDEESIRATNERHRHDQALMSLLVYRILGEVAISDIGIYGGHLSPRQAVGQKVWVHRRRMAPTDQRILAESIGQSPAPFIPGEPGWDREPITWRTAIPRAWRYYFGGGRSGKVTEEERRRSMDGIR